MKEPRPVVLGCEASDEITGFTGVVTGRIEYLYGCNQWGLTPKCAKPTDQPGDTRWFDEGRVRWTAQGIAPEQVQAARPGAGEAPTRAHGRMA